MPYQYKCNQCDDPCLLTIGMKPDFPPDKCPWDNIWPGQPKWVEEAISDVIDTKDEWRCKSCLHQWFDNGFEWPTNCPKCGHHVMEQV